MAKKKPDSAPDKTLADPTGIARDRLSEAEPTPGSDPAYAQMDLTIPAAKSRAMQQALAAAMPPEPSSSSLPIVLPDAPESVRMPDAALHVASKRIEAGETAWVKDPWTGVRVAPVVLATKALALQAAEASAKAFATTRRLPSFMRRRILKDVTRRIVQARADLAELIVRESGKPKTLALFEVDRAIVTFGLAAEEAVRIGGEVIPLDVTEATQAYRGHWTRVPRGPVLGITPFNFPLNLVAHKVAPALAAGCPVVLKPAPQTPLTALKLAEIVRASGAPPDILQVVPCTNDVAAALVASEHFTTLSFTGSAKVGFELKAKAGKKHVTLELGGNAACIVHDDAPVPLPQLAAIVCASAFNYAGQVCIKTQRLFLQRRVAERFLGELVPRACAYVPGDPHRDETAIGPMIDEAAARRVESWVERAVAGGASALVTGKRDGNRMPAIVLRLEGDGAGLEVVEEEIFGPVLVVHVYDKWSDALRQVNRTRYGLQCGVFTDSMSRIQEAFDTLDVGALVVNDVPSARVDAMPYGGRKDSGVGREGVRYAIEEMTERKLMLVRT
ncbi:MAG: aldehyde dehydrogenase family protein [Myxococcales bacterium]|nr:aldehyde dehydrogenase family protein [Myxococcales bacterium]